MANALNRRSFLGIAAVSIIPAKMSFMDTIHEGHNLPEEAPREFTDAVWELASAKN